MKKLWNPFKKVWKFVILLFLIILTFSYAMFQGGFVSWFLFYSFLPFCPLLYRFIVLFIERVEKLVDKYRKQITMQANH